MSAQRRSGHILKDGRTLILRDPTLDDAPDLMEYLKIVGGKRIFSSWTKTVSRS